MPSTSIYRARFKQADLGGPGNDVSFEQSFSSLASAYLRDKAPALLDYEVGFQTIQREEDQNKAVGVFGFKAGPTWLMAPVFFVGGDLKGHELLYIKNDDQFVPMEEGWINDILAKVPPAMGESVDRSGRALGVRYPDLQRDLQGPRKYARLVTPAERVALAKEAAEVMAKGGAAAAPLAKMPDWAKVGVAALLATAPHPGATMTLLDLLAEGGVKVAAALDRHLSDYPRLREGFDKFYSAADVEAAAVRVKAAAAMPTAPMRVRSAPFAGSLFAEIEHDAARAVRSKVAVHKFNGWETPSILLDDNEKMAMVSDGMFIKDARDDDEVSKAYAVDVKVDFPAAYTNPDQTGMYDVLTKDGDIERCLIVTGPLGPAKRMPWCTIVRMESGRRAFLNVHPNHVWTVRRPGTGQNAGINDGYTWWEKLDASKSDSVSEGSYYLAVGPAGDGTVPFRVHDSKGDDVGGGKAYEVVFDDHASADRSDSLCNTAVGLHFKNDGKSPDGQYIHLGQRSGSKLRFSSGDVYVPEGHKLLKLEDDVEDEKADEKDDNGFPTSKGMVGRSKKSDPLRLGDALSVEIGIRSKTASLRVAVDGLKAAVNDVPMSKAAALIHLVSDLGLREDPAREILEAGARAKRIWNKCAEYRIKIADPYRKSPYLTDGGPNAPGMLDPSSAPDGTFGDGQSTQTPFEQAAPVTDMIPDSGNRDAYQGEAEPDQGAVQMAQQASETGHRELFDTSMIGSLLKSTSDDAMVDRYMPDQMKALHNWGCMLLEFHWNGERFAERYGEAEMPELEDSLRNTFETNGKTILFLRRKTTVASPDESAMNDDLGDVAD